MSCNYTLQRHLECLAKCIWNRKYLGIESKSLVVIMKVIFKKYFSHIKITLVANWCALCFCGCLLRLKSDAAHVLENRRATFHVRIPTTDPPPEAVTLCKNISMFSRSGAKMQLLLSSTQPRHLSKSMKPDSLPPWLQPCLTQHKIASAGMTQTSMSQTTLLPRHQCKRKESR